MTRLLLLLALAGLIGACGSIKLQPDSVARLGASPTLAGGTYTSGGGLTIAADLREMNGQSLLCGVWAQSENQSILTKLVEKDVLGSASVWLEDRRLLHNLVFMREVDPAPDYAGAEAHCVRLENRPWQPGDAARDLTIRIPKQIVYQDISEGLGAVTVHFKPTGPAAEN